MIAIAITALFAFAATVGLATIMVSARGGIAAYRAIAAELAQMDARLNWPREQLRPADSSRVNPSRTGRRMLPPEVFRGQPAAA